MACCLLAAWIFGLTLRALRWGGAGLARVFGRGTRAEQPPVGAPVASRRVVVPAELRASSAR